MDDKVNKSAKHLALRIVVITFLLSFGYAILRYQVFGPVLWKDLPLFILNKGISLTGFLLLTLSIILNSLKNSRVKVSEKYLSISRIIGPFVFWLILAHVIISLMLLDPAYYGKLYTSQSTLTLFGGISLFGGVISFLCFLFYNGNFQNQSNIFGIFSTQHKEFALLLMGGIHLFFMGFGGWFTPDKWYGFMPPITLIGFTFFIISFAFKLVEKN